MKHVALALVASGLAATVAAAFPDGPPPHPHAEPLRPVEFVSRYAAELRISDATLEQIRAVEEQQRAERDVIAAELRAQKRALRTLLAGANPREAEAIALARKIGTLETDLSVSRLTAMMRMHALLTPEQNEALHEKMRGRFFERREVLGAATAACEPEIAQHCEEGDGPPGPAVMCLLHKRRAENLALSAACETALQEIPPPFFVRHRGPPPGVGAGAVDVLVPAPPGEPEDDE
jgi:Spy/CpxP family protein refolding chaperone